MPLNPLKLCLHSVCIKNGRDETEDPCSVIENVKVVNKNHKKAELD